MRLALSLVATFALSAGLSSAVLFGCAHAPQGYELAPVAWHGDKNSPKGCICAGHLGQVACECDPAVVDGAAGVWK